MRTAVVTFPGINRDRDIAAAFARAGVVTQSVWHTETSLPDVDLVVLPGGFSYGDYLRAGAMAAHAPVMRAVADHAARGGYVLAVCNGFQIATEARLLPGALLRNASRRFIARDAFLRVERAGTAFTKLYARGAVLRAPLAHGEGNYFADGATLAELEDSGRVAFRYCDRAGETLHEAPNGSAHAIAGIYSENLRVLGLMPHLENVTEALTGGTDGAKLFEAFA